MSPGELDLEVNTIKTQVGPIQLYKYVYHEPDAAAPVFLYSISYYAYPEGLISSDSLEMTEQFFSETLAAISERIGGEVIYSEVATYKDYPARITRISYNDGAYSLKNKLILVDNKFYLLEVFSTLDQSVDYKVNKFIDSFTLKE